jgi:hypothetical protein
VTAGVAVQPTSSDKGALDMLVGGSADLPHGCGLTTKHVIAADPRSSAMA